MKILQLDPLSGDRAALETSLPHSDGGRFPQSFESLDDTFCSLGESLDYYEWLYEAGREVYEPVLTGLRDVVFDPTLRLRFEHLEGFQVSLLRYSESEKAFREAGALFGKRKDPSIYAFTFRCKVPGAVVPHEVEMDFSPHATGLNRTIVLIGRNGTGKTRLLAEFAQAMSGRKLQSNDLEFTPQRPSFRRVIAVSYSAFDDFDRPSEGGQSFSYKYCGIRKPNMCDLDNGSLPEQDGQAVADEFFKVEELTQRLEDAFSSFVDDAERYSKWKEIIEIMLEGDVDMSSYHDRRLDFYATLSSGQKILVAVLTQIVAYIQPQSVILFDEPELHLHPEVFAALARSLARLLDDFDSYSIIATHSPLLLQETPARQVRVLKREDGVPYITPLTIESFGENLSTITREVFEVDGSKHNFRAVLDRLLEDRTAEEVESLFDNGLPLQAKMYLKSQGKAVKND